MISSTSFSPDLPELRLIAQLAGLKPSAIAAGLNNPEFFNEHVSAEELKRFLDAALRVVALIHRIDKHLIHAARIQKTKRGQKTHVR